MTRKRKLLYFICLPLLLIAIALAIFLGAQYFMGESEESNQSSSGFRMMSSECYLVDYEITGDIIKFRYAVCFQNGSKRDVTVSGISIAFKRSQLRGWLKYEKSYDAKLENGQGEFLIKSGEKVDVIYVVTGTYLGGAVNEQLSSPKRAVYLYQFKNPEEQGDGSVVPSVGEGLDPP